MTIEGESAENKILLKANGFYQTPIEYDLCQSVFKFQFGESKQTHYLKKHHATIQTQLCEMGMPFEPQNFLRGTGYDLLFLKNHGIIAKIGGSHDPINHIHPVLSQPLGWVTNNKTHLTLCLYAGEQLPKNLSSEILKEIESALFNSGQYGGDVDYTNVGSVSYGEKNNHILIDVDRKANRTLSKSLRQQKQSLFKALWDRKGINNAVSHREIMHEVYGDNRDLTPWLTQMDRHQELRELFWTAQNIPIEERAPALKQFWDTAALHTSNPPTNVYPLYRDYLIP